ncbi:acyl-CoA N-acyltransferase [Desarmillaria tabescens]|uniref:Acyl-CoA N-acyltransferase n=1 Tax=Armillaria tabescens TaxID=1929756 RepID=A0AA39JUY0_ARMTA|nr:acyl-CoA N-acyltransferase [Desarmillaria tabescens]KAK0448350.1 acyl-CoA N-acyltransferase [Desarmillaria tabescens]
MSSTATPVGYRAEHFVAPAEQTFKLPDGSPVNSVDTEGVITVTSGNSVITFAPQERVVRVSPYGIVNDDRAVSEAVLLISSTTPVTTRDLWISVYALWLRKNEEDVVPVVIDETLSNANELQNYFTYTGLGHVPDASNPTTLLLSRPAFWQSAGAPLGLSWLRDPIPSPSLAPLPSLFPYVQSFTRGPHVLTTHPLRPPPTSPGSRELLTFTHIDASNPAHFEAYTRWQNSDRVNVGWREKGDDEHHRAYLKDRLADPHIMGFIVSWNEEAAGYGEMSWVKEDPMGTYVGGLGDYDQGTHLLVGEERFRGRQRFTAIMTSMKHMCFLREPRTEVVVGEPRADLPIIPRLTAYLPQEFNRVRLR